MKYVTQFFCLLVVLQIGIAQQTGTSFSKDQSSEPVVADESLRFNVNRMLKPMSITPEMFLSAQNLTDLYRHYKPTWVRTYHGVEITTQCNGEVVKSLGSSYELTSEQKDVMALADEGSEIEVRVNYIPENTLKDNPMKEFVFKFTVDPDQEAEFPGGHQKLMQYIDAHAMTDFPDGLLNENDLAAVTFTIDEKGQINDVEVYESTKNKKIDNLLVDVIQNMPPWHPAQHGNGKPVAQKFVLTIGNMESCIINLLYIRRLPEE